MEEDVDILEVARAMLAAYGAEAVAVMLERAVEHLRAGEHEGAEFWHRVARAIQRMIGGTA